MLEWNDEYLIGVEDLDNDHRLIIKFANEAFQALVSEKDRKTFREKVILFENEMVLHLAREEEFMKSTNFFDLENHLLLHKEMKEKLHSIVKNEGRRSNDNKINVLSDIIDFVRYYIVDHLSSEDKKIGLFLNSNAKELTSNKVQKLTESEFYTSLEYFHDRIYNLQKLIMDYFESKRKQCEKTYLGVKIIENHIQQSTIELDKNAEERIINWLRIAYRKEFYHSIYKIDLHEKVYMFKIFEFDVEKLVLAGYLIKDSVNVRLFLSTLSENVIQERYERILAII